MGWCVVKAAILTLVLGVLLSVGACADGPVINSVSLAPALVAAGDLVHVIANVTDAASTVTSVTAGQTPLSPTGGGKWEGDVPADSALGSHWVGITATNAAGIDTVLAHAAQYATTVIYGINTRHALYETTRVASDKYLFKVWGKVKWIDWTTFTVSDGSQYPVRVISPEHDVADDDIVWARGILDDSNAPPAVLRYGQYSIIKMGPRQPMSINDANVGKDLQVPLSGTLPAPTPAGQSLKVTITSTDPSRVLVSKTADAQGSAAVCVTVPSGSIVIPAFYVQGLAGSGSVDMVASAPGGLRKVFKVNLFPSGFVIASPSAINTAVVSADSPVTIKPALLNPTTLAFGEYQSLRGGLAGVSVPVVSSNMAVGTIATSPVAFAPGAAGVDAQFHPVGAGTSTISITAPDGFSTPSTRQSISATVASVGITASDAVVGKELQMASSFRLGAVPPGPTDVTVTVESSAVATVSAVATAEGTGSLVISGVTTASDQTFYVQGRELGTTTLSVSAPGYGVVTKTITVTPSGFVITSNNINTTTFSSNSIITVRPARLDADTLAYVEYQNLRGGIANTKVDVVSEKPTVGMIAGSPLWFGPNASSMNAQFHPVGSGTSLISVTVPSNFSLTTTQQCITAIVTAPDIIAGDAVVGRNLQMSGSFSLASPPPGAVDVSVTVGDDTIATVSTVATAEGAGSVMVNGVSTSNTQVFYVQGRALGTTSLTIAAEGYNVATKTITVTPSGFVITSPAINTTSISPNSTVTVQSARLDSSTLASLQYQPVRGGLAGVSVPVVSSSTPVGMVTPSLLTFNANVGSLNTQFDPAGVGTATISVTAPAGFDTPSNNQSIEAKVTGPGIYADDTIVGRDLQLTKSCYLLATPSSARDITVTVGSTAIATISKDMSVVGTGSVTFSGVTTMGSQLYYVQGRSLGTTTLTVTADGYTPVTKTITVDPSGFVITTLDFTTHTWSPNSAVHVKPALLYPSDLAYRSVQPLRAGIGSVSVPVVSSNPAVGKITNSPLTFASLGNDLTATFDPLIQGTVTVSADAPVGFSTPSTSRQITVKVDP